jgi:hypothetical protein
MIATLDRFEKLPGEYGKPPQCLACGAVIGNNETLQAMQLCSACYDDKVDELDDANEVSGEV